MFSLNLRLSHRKRLLICIMTGSSCIHPQCDECVCTGTLGVHQQSHQTFGYKQTHTFSNVLMLSFSKTYVQLFSVSVCQLQCVFGAPRGTGRGKLKAAIMGLEVWSAIVSWEFGKPGLWRVGTKWIGPRGWAWRGCVFVWASCVPGCANGNKCVCMIEGGCAVWKTPLYARMHSDGFIINSLPSKKNGFKLMFFFCYRLLILYPYHIPYQSKLI